MIFSLGLGDYDNGVELYSYIEIYKIGCWSWETLRNSKYIVVVDYWIFFWGWSCITNEYVFESTPSVCCSYTYCALHKFLHNFIFHFSLPIDSNWKSIQIIYLWNETTFTSGLKYFSSQEIPLFKKRKFWNLTNSEGIVEVDGTYVQI